MKKRTVCAALAAAMLPGTALAEEMLMAEFTDWNRMATYSGAMAAVMLIVQFLKVPVGAFGRVPMRLVVYAVSVAVLMGAQAFTGTLNGWQDAALAALNGVAVALGAMNLYERTLGKDQAA